MGARAWISLAGVVGTWFMFGAAIWGEWIRSRLFKPELHLTYDPVGVSTTEKIRRIAGIDTEGMGAVSGMISAQPFVEEYTRPARYYYLSVTNARRWPAHDVRILITRLEIPDPGGVPTIKWTGEIPLRWEHSEIQPASRTLSRRAARADFAVAAQDPKEPPGRRNQLHFLPVIEPNNFPRSYYSAMRAWITVIATSTEADSPALRLEVAWDGQWEPGEAEMSRHLPIREAHH